MYSMTQSQATQAKGSRTSFLWLTDSDNTSPSVVLVSAVTNHALTKLPHGAASYNMTTIQMLMKPNIPELTKAADRQHQNEGAGKAWLWP